MARRKEGDPGNLLRVLRERVARMPEANSRFAGLPAPALDLPHNVCIHVRSTRDGLSGAPHLNPEVYVLVLALRGAGTVVVENNAFPMKARQGLLIFPRQFHFYTRVTRGPLCWLVISFRLSRDNGLEVLRGERLTLGPAFLGPLDRLLAGYREMNELNPDACARVALYLLLCLIEWRDEISRRGGGCGKARRRIEPAVAGAIRYILEHLGDPLQIKDIAAAVGLSVTGLQQRFKQGMGQPLGAYIGRMRVYRARFLLADPSIEIKEVASQSGFASIQAFCRAFRRASGTTPSAYRAQQTVNWNSGGDARSPVLSPSAPTSQAGRRRPALSTSGRKARRRSRP